MDGGFGSAAFRRTRVKICGIQNVAELTMAVSYGADALGAGRLFLDDLHHDPR